MSDLSDNKKVWRTLKEFNNYEATECLKVRKLDTVVRRSGEGWNKDISKDVSKGKGPILKPTSGGVNLMHPVRKKKVWVRLDRLLDMWREAGE